MGYLSSARLHRGGYGVNARRGRGGIPLLGIAGTLLGGAIKRTASGVLRKLKGPTVKKAVGMASGAATAITIGSAIPGLGRNGAEREAFGGRRKRMNVANPKALRRAIRRTDGFVKLARKTLKGTGFTIARRGLSKAARPARKR